jgi:hypothetical protein
MKNAALLVGIWLGIIFFAYSVVYLQADGPAQVTMAGDTETIDEQNGFSLPLPLGWSLRAIDGAAELTAPISGVEAWALSVPAGTAEGALAAAWEVLDPCSSCQRPAVLETTPLSDGRQGVVLALASDADGRTGRAVVLLQGESARVLLIRLGAGISLPERVDADLARIEAGFRAIETGGTPSEPVEAPAA